MAKTYAKIHSSEDLSEVGQLSNRLCEGADYQVQGTWREAIMIPIRKPGKDPSKPTSCRPMALTSNTVYAR